MYIIDASLPLSDGKSSRPKATTADPTCQYSSHWMISGGAFRQKSRVRKSSSCSSGILTGRFLGYVEAPESSRRNKDTGDSSENSAAWKKSFPQLVGNENVWNAYQWNTRIAQLSYCMTCPHKCNARKDIMIYYDIEFIERNLQNATNLKLSMNRGCRRPYGFGHTFTCSCKLKQMIEV